MSNDFRAVELSITEHGGNVAVFGKGNDKTRAVMAVNEYGNGVGKYVGLEQAIASQLGGEVNDRLGELREDIEQLDQDDKNHLAKHNEKR